MFKYLATVVISISVVMLSAFSVYASEIAINDVTQTSDGKVSVKCSISEESDSQRITVISYEVGDETYTEDIVYVDEFVPEISDGEFSFEFEPASWVTYNKGYILRIGGNDIDSPAELAIVYVNDMYIILIGDIDGNDILTANDAACLLEKVLNSGYKMAIEDKTDDYIKYTDVNNDGILTANDAACILEKVLNSSYILPVENK